MKEALKLALETAEGIANSDWRKWEEFASPEEFERWVKRRALHMATTIKEALAQPESNPWREAVEDELVTAHILNASHSDPRKAVKDAIDWHVQVALDPQVSSDAAALIDRGMKQERALWTLTKLGQEIEAQPEQDAAAFIAAEDRKVASRYGYVPKLHPSEWQDAQRPWVGLTDEEKQEWIDAMPYDIEPRHCMILVNVIEAKLKEKNT